MHTIVLWMTLWLAGGTKQQFYFPQAPNGTVRVQDCMLGRPVPIYFDVKLKIHQANPFVLDAKGHGEFATFPGCYQIEIAKSNP